MCSRHLGADFVFAEHLQKLRDGPEGAANILNLKLQKLIRRMKENKKLPSTEKPIHM